MEEIIEGQFRKESPLELAIETSIEAQDVSIEITLNSDDRLSNENVAVTVLVVENSKLPRVTYSLTLDNPPYAEGTKKGVSDLLSSLLGSGTEKISKNDFNE